MKPFMARFGTEACDGDCEGKQNTSIDGGEGVTINDGDGTKDTIVMTGPLSQVFTKALGIYFAKSPIEGDDGGEMATETQAIDSTVQQLIAQAGANSNLFDGAENRLVLVNQFDNFNENPAANVITIPASNAGRPEVIQEVSIARNIDASVDRETVLLISAVYDQSLKQETKVVDIVDNSHLDNTLVEPIAGENGTPTVESIYKNIKGLTIVHGVKGFGEWVNNKLKK